MSAWAHGISGPLVTSRILGAILPKSVPSAHLDLTGVSFDVGWLSIRDVCWQDVAGFMIAAEGDTRSWLRNLHLADPKLTSIICIIEP